MQKNCKNCSQPFEITDDDLKFYDKVSPVFNGKKYQVPPPTLCPDCRQQRRLAFRNERSLYKRKCDATGKEIISMYSPDPPAGRAGKPVKVYDQTEWWSDRFNPLEYGRDLPAGRQGFDFNQPFFEQFEELLYAVPHISLFGTNNENSEYTNYTLNLKNCYLIFGGANNEDSFYGHFISNCKDIMDGSSLYSCELCYEGIASQGCFNCLFFTKCRNCIDCFMVEDCLSCRNCIGCFGLRQKEYYVFNQPAGKEKFEEYKKALFANLNWQKISDFRNQFNNLKLKLPHNKAFIVASENCEGDMIFNSHNCFNAFDATDCEECKNLFFVPRGKNSHDVTFASPYGTEWSYDVCSCPGTNYSMATFLSWNNINVFYSLECHNSKHLFGCTGLKKNEYCILNKQYTKEEYEKLAPKIIEHMMKTGEWGEYFPIQISFFGYNETIMQEYFPMTKKEAASKGYKWREEHADARTKERKNERTEERINISENIKDVPDSITKEILACENCQKNYKIIPQELKFYREMNLPIPRKCPDCRHKDRLILRNPRKLWKRNCANCKAEIQTTYAPERPEIVYCEKCYLETVY